MGVSKSCQTCGLVKPVSEFHKNAKSPDGYKPTCKLCYKTARNERLVEKHGSLKEASRFYNEQSKTVSRIIIREWLEQHPCLDCGIQDWRVLEFDHVRGKKLFNICDKMSANIDKLLEEIQKCDVVCANCHKIRTFERSGSWRSL